MSEVVRIGDQPLKCMICGASDEDGRIFLVGGQVIICDECVVAAFNALKNNAQSKDWTRANEAMRKIILEQAK